jgi:hypothetical protein
MKQTERQSWTAPDGTDYVVSVHELTIDAGRLVRRMRRVEFESLDGRTIGSTSFPGYLTLHLVTPGELASLWNLAVGE